MNEAPTGIPEDSGSNLEKTKVREEIQGYFPIVNEDANREWFMSLSLTDLRGLLEAVKFHKEWHLQNPDPDAIIDRSGEPHQTPLERRRAVAEEEICERELRRRLSKPHFKKYGMTVLMMILRGDCPTIEDLHHAIVGLTGKTPCDAATFAQEVGVQFKLAAQFARKISKTR